MNVTTLPTKACRGKNKINSAEKLSPVEIEARTSRSSVFLCCKILEVKAKILVLNNRLPHTRHSVTIQCQCWQNSAMTW